MQKVKPSRKAWPSGHRGISEPASAGRDLRSLVSSTVRYQGSCDVATSEAKHGIKTNCHKSGWRAGYFLRALERETGEEAKIFWMIS